MTQKNCAIKCQIFALVMESTALFGPHALNASSTSLKDMPPEVLHHMASFLPFESQKNFGATCQQFRHLVQGIHEDTLKPLWMAGISYDGQKKQKAQDLLKDHPSDVKPMLDALKKKRFKKETVLFETHGYVMKRCHDPMAADLNGAFLASGKASVKPLYDLITNDQKGLLKRVLFEDTPHKDHDTLLYHMMKQYQYYVSNHISETQKKSFRKNILDETLTSSMKTIQAQNNYVSFDRIDQYCFSQSPATIVLSAQEMGHNKKLLERMLDSNPDHTLMVKVDASVVTQNNLFLSKEDMPSNLRHLVISDMNHCVQAIKDGFLMKSDNLMTFDTLGFTSLTNIGHNFLSGAINLTHFHTLGITSLTCIGGGFLQKAETLIHFDASGLTSLAEIGDHFLYGAKNLTTFDTSGLTSVTNIGGSFLVLAKNLTHFDTSGLTCLTKMGNNFLGGAINLTHFDASGLTSLRNIGARFLLKAEKLTHFDASGLTSLVKIGDEFLVDNNENMTLIVPDNMQPSNVLQRTLLKRAFRSIMKKSDYERFRGHLPSDHEHELCGSYSEVDSSKPVDDRNLKRRRVDSM